MRVELIKKSDSLRLPVHLRLSEQPNSYSQSEEISEVPVGETKAFGRRKASLESLEHVTEVPANVHLR